MKILCLQIQTPIDLVSSNTFFLIMCACYDYTYVFVMMCIIAFDDLYMCTLLSMFCLDVHVIIYVLFRCARYYLCFV